VFLLGLGITASSSLSVLFSCHLDVLLNIAPGVQAKANIVCPIRLPVRPALAVDALSRLTVEFHRELKIRPNSNPKFEADPKIIHRFCIRQLRLLSNAPPKFQTMFEMIQPSRIFL
jgi:hypothetical protein